MAKVLIDGKEHFVEDGITIIQACEEVGIQIPRFCYHEKLAIAGNCRMCLVEVEKSPKPVASCSIAVADGMVIRTESEMVRRAREGVMEFLLINHPLDCPICDQGGECDLQDQAFKYGRRVSNYHEEKRAVADKYMGPLIATNMTRCIHCTRCVRFLDDIAGTNELGAIGRGENMEVSTYVEKSIQSEMSGNIIDLCPVGALTSKPSAFSARSWELQHTYSVDVMDAVGSHIRIDTRGNEVIRILPQACEAINEEWISDKTRFAYDGLKYQRLDKAFTRQQSSFQPTTYQQAIEEAAKCIRESKSMGIVAGKLSDVETMFAAKQLLQKLGRGYCEYEVQLHGLVSQSRSDYIFNSTIAEIESADHCLLINTNPRHEAALINARIRKSVVHNDMSVAFIGEQVTLNYEHNHLGIDTGRILLEILSGEHEYCKTLAAVKKPIMIIGSTAFASDNHDLHNICKKIAGKHGFVVEGWNGFNILHHSAAAVGALDIGFVNYKINHRKVHHLSDCETLILFGADDIDVSNLTNCKIIYVGHHGDKNVYAADIIIPSSAYVEKSGTYVNTEGRVQRTTQAVKAPGEAQPEHKIILDIAKALNFKLAFTDLDSIRSEMVKANKIFAEDNLFKIIGDAFTTNEDSEGRIDLSGFCYPINDFYCTDSISRSSRVMAECRNAINKTK